MPRSRLQVNQGRADWHRDLVITLDVATSEHCPMVFVEEEGTASSFPGIAEFTISDAGIRSLSCDGDSPLSRHAS